MVLMTVVTTVKKKIVLVTRRVMLGWLLVFLLYSSCCSSLQFRFVCVLIYYVVRSRRPVVQTRVIRSTPSTAVPTVVTLSQDTAFTTAAPHTTQQMVYKDAQFGSQIHLPYFDAGSASVLANPPPVAQVHIISSIILFLNLQFT